MMLFILYKNSITTIQERKKNTDAVVYTVQK